jgi:signal transduction histidine kinase
MVNDITERIAIEQMKSEFVSVASHEMRTPLTSIHGVIQLLAAGRLGKLEPTAQKMVEIAAKNTRRLTRLINDVLDLERMESGRETIELTICNSVELVQQAIDTMTEIAREYQITLSAQVPSLQIWADADKILQTLTNLLSNAIKFSPPHSEVLIRVIPQDSEVLFQISDRGRGIPADKLKSIFERFQQVDASDSREKGGTGLGLAICRHIVRQHGGRIWAESTLGEGSSFYFTLPNNPS